MPTTRKSARRDTEEVAFVSPDPVESEEALSARPSSAQSAKTKSKSASNARPGPDSGPVAPRQPSAERAEAAAYTEVANRLLALEEKDQHWDQQVNDLTQRICVQDDAIESLKKRLAVLEGKPSRSSDAERTTISHRWAWREVSQIGEEFFDLLEKPFTKSVFVEFVKNAEVTSGIAEIPPLEARYRLIKGSPETRGFYEKVLTAIKKENSEGLTERYVREILSELAGMFMVLSADGMCPLTLGQFLALGKTSRERARGYPEKSYTEHQKGAQTLMVGMLMRQRQRNMAWYKIFPTEPEVVAGEAIKNVNHWRALLAAADDTSAALSALSNATVVGSIAPHHRSVSEVAASRHSVAPTLHNWVLPGAVTHPTYGAPPRKDPGGGLGARKNPLGVDGPIFVGNRCAKCGHVGHRHPACPGPSHPSFKADKPWGLLTDMSHGKIRLP
jgi:hypothetical protein